MCDFMHKASQRQRYTEKDIIQAGNMATVTATCFKVPFLYQVLCMMKVGLYNKALKCINQLMAIATSL